MKLSAALALAFVGFGCADLDEANTAQETSALLNGTSTTARPEVARFWPPGGGTCTATLISDRTFLTAAHCIDYAWQSIGGQLEVQGVGLLNVIHTFSQGGETGVDDIAVGRLQTSVSGITPATVSNVQPSNQNLTTMGYGCVTARNEEDCPNASDYDRTYITYYYNGDNSYIHSSGDSGGPTFLGNLGDNGSIVRVHSAHYLPNGADIGADAVQFRSHINQLSQALTGTGIMYRSQVQAQGWTPAVGNGTTSGTTGQSLRLEGLQVWLPDQAATNRICYQAYVQDQGWQTEVCDGELAGTVGQAKRLEAIKMRCVPKSVCHVCGASAPVTTCSVRYNVYVQDLGWQGWVSDTAIAGTTGQSRRIEAIKIELQ